MGRLIFVTEELWSSKLMELNVCTVEEHIFVNLHNYALPGEMVVKSVIVTVHFSDYH